ncbi:hypothetical protein TPHA_0D02910 [Tetrapisispora phaffii CBS 4417]|uniref:Glycoside hydrolase family 5 domain-containing protein n=1 Tax=Tetrapisispora phaffii (strain ATCC 24235 / CBS 4417 / NBRC 1672 / NRRL Y-8282 / UCD 70-5) TaxID=1071381 RepID=G8BSV6_TETPH|nr:hypothetical protein TPHA_0D02910 [Tetrapisispora phaffii CBS 4417]CCE62927.1 hypothetical protein TPHA_0D02910 [Tetrapisispora phaffii CBS 4417]
MFSFLSHILFTLYCLSFISVSEASNDGLDLIQLKVINDKLNLLKKKSSNSTTSNIKVGEIRGISLGGWLVTEPYITPSLYHNATEIYTSSNSSYSNLTDPIIDEHTFCEKLGYETAGKLLQAHYESFITEDDFRQISEDGFNLVRIPIGYWAWKQNNETNEYIDGVYFEDPYFSNGIQLQYLSKAIGWASKYNLSIWVDLHGAPGSQNGFDNSGKRDLYGTPGWLSVDNSTELTLAIWNDIFETYVINEDQDTTPIIGIEIMNEPLSSKVSIYDITKAYYEGFGNFERLKESNSNTTYNTTFVIHDAFEGIGHWNLEFNPQYQNVSSQYVNISDLSFKSQDILVDHHHYEVFSDYQLANSQFRRIYDIIEYGESIFDELAYHPALVGEWSGAITDCATWLNGVGIGARYDGSYYDTTNFTTDSDITGQCTSQLSFEQWSEEYKINVRQFIEAQLATYTSQTTGWIFWNWKTEDAIEWDYLKLKEAGLFPVPLDNYTYFNNDGSIKNSVSRSLSVSAYPKMSSTTTKTTKTTSSTKLKSLATSLTKSTMYVTKLTTTAVSSSTSVLAIMTIIAISLIWL